MFEFCISINKIFRFSVANLRSEERNALHFAIKQQSHVFSPVYNSNTPSGNISSKNGKYLNGKQSLYSDSFRTTKPCQFSGGLISRNVEKLVGKLSTECEERIGIYHRRMKVKSEQMIFFIINQNCLSITCNNFFTLNHTVIFSLVLYI